MTTTQAFLQNQQCARNQDQTMDEKQNLLEANAHRSSSLMKHSGERRHFSEGPQFEATIIALSHDGRGIARPGGKTTFIEGALPGEVVRFTYQKKRGRFDEGTVVEVLQAAPERVSPACVYYGICGGCQLQHMSVSAQRQFKQNAFLEQLKAFADIVPAQLLPPLTGSDLAYRRRARLGVKYVAKKQDVLVGFREKNGRYLADIQSCKILAPPFNTLIPTLRDLLGRLSIHQHIPQIEVASGDTQATLIIRHMLPLSLEDREQLLRFAQAHQLWLYLQPGGIDSIHRLWPQDDNSQMVSYSLDLSQNPVLQSSSRQSASEQRSLANEKIKLQAEGSESGLDQALKLHFEPWDFIQINAEINQKMVVQALNLLDLQPTDHILELFCGLGNFSLALARHCHALTGVEGSADLVERATANAQRNHIQNANFYVADLFKSLTELTWAQQRYTHLLLDPPRSGAIELIAYLSDWKPHHIVYVSCNPATLARDASALVKQGYYLHQAGLIDMFPHTHHSEWICLFKKR